MDKIRRKSVNILLIMLFIFCFDHSILAQNNLQEEQWFLKAKPCWASGKQVEKNLTIALHSVVDIKNFSKARFRIVAASCYKLFVNGAFISYGPSITAHGFFRVDEYDLQNNLKIGKNVLAIEAAGYNVDNYYIPNQPSFVQAELVIDNDVAAATLIGNAKGAFTFAILKQRVQDAPKFSFQRTFSEEYKLQPGYDTWKGSFNIDFPKVKAEQTDKKNLLPRRVNYPDYSFREATEDPTTQIFKFEKNSTGFIVAIIHAAKPSKLILYWDEILENGDIKKGRLGYNSFIKYDLDPGNYTLESFEPYTLQYLKLEVVEGTCELKTVKIRQYVNSAVSKASFKTNDSTLNKIFDAAVETHKQNALDIFTDCPSRERAGWLCDSYFSARVANTLSGNTIIERNFLENYLLPVKFANIPDGMLPMCYPSDHTNGNFIPNWAMWFVLQLDEYVQRSGDYEMAAALKPKVINLLSYFGNFKNEDGLLEKLDKWIFVEWSKANDFVQDVNYPTNMLYSKMLEVVGRLYKIPEYLTESEKIKEVIRKQSYINGFFSDNAIRDNGKLVVQGDNQSEVCQYYAYYFNIANPQQFPELWQRLIDKFGPSRRTNDQFPNIFPANSFVGNYLRLELLSREGLTKQLIQETKEQFSIMANTTGTLWENTFPGTSCCHGFASHVAHLFYRDITGFFNIDKFNKEITIHFNDLDLDWCEASIPIDNEAISIKWEKKSDKIIYNINAPSGYTVDIINNSKLNLEKQ